MGAVRWGGGLWKAIVWAWYSQCNPRAPTDDYCAGPAQDCAHQQSAVGQRGNCRPFFSTLNYRLPMVILLWGRSPLSSLDVHWEPTRLQWIVLNSWSHRWPWSNSVVHGPRGRIITHSTANLPFHFASLKSQPANQEHCFYLSTHLLKEHFWQKAFCFSSWITNNLPCTL